MIINNLLSLVNLFRLPLMFKMKIVCAWCRVLIPLSIFCFCLIEKVASQDIGGGSISNEKIVQNNSLSVNQFVDYTLDKALMAETVHIMGNFDYVNEKYAFPEGDTVFAWIRFVNISAQYQMVFDWYTPTGAYYGNYTSVSTSPGPALWAGWLISPPCINGLWRVDYKLKDVATGVITTVASKNFTTVCNCATLTAPAVGLVTQPSCTNSTGSVFLSGLPSNWTLTRNPDGVTTSGTTASVTVSGIPTGTYSYTVKNNVTACISPSSINFVINNPPQGASIPSVTASQTTNCGTKNTTLSIASGSLNSATAWQWYSSSCGGTPIGSGVINVSPTTTTTYYARGEGGVCPSGSCGQVTITVNPLPSVPVIGTITQPTCSQPTGKVMLSGLPTSGTWTLKDINTGVQTMGTGSSFEITNLIAGNHTFEVTNSVGCISPLSTSITIIAAPQGATTPSVSATQMTICKGQSTNLSITNGLLNNATSWQWYSAGCGVSSESSGRSLQVSPSVTTTYYVRGEGNGCIGQCGQITITVESPPSSPTINGLLSAYCQNSGVVSLVGTPSGGTFTIDGQTRTQLDPTVLTVGSHDIVYTVRSTGGACVATKTQTISIEAPPALPTINNLQTSYCKNSLSVNLSGTPTGGIFTIDGTAATQFAPAVLAIGSRVVAYKINSASGLCSVTRNQTVQVHPIYTITENKSFCKGDSFLLPNGTRVATAGTYTSNLKTRFTNCDSIITTNLTENSLPILSISGPTQNCPNGVLTLTTAPASFATYKWSTGETSSSIQKAPNTPTTYSVSVTDANGCKGSASTNITIGDTVRITLDTIICKGITYTFPDNTQTTQASTHTYRYQNANGCSVVLTTILRIDTSLNCGLVAYYKLDGNAADSSGNNNHGTPVGGVTWTKNRFGSCNSAASFDGVDDKIDLSYKFGSYKEITISAWAKINAYKDSSFQAIVSSNELESVHFQMYDVPNILSATTGAYTDSTHIQLPVLMINPLNQWRHFVMTISSGNSKLYENGVQLSSSNLLFNYITSTNLLKIGSGFQNSRFLNGSLDDIRIYNRALSSSEITQLYNQQEPVLLPPSVNIAPTAPEICSGDSLILRANVVENNLRYQWSRNGQTNLADTLAALKITKAGNYTLRSYRANGCDDLDTVFVKPKILVDNGLVAYYPFDGDALDYSGNGNHGMVNGNVSITTDRHNQVNKAFYFNGTEGDYLNCGNGSSIKVINDFTISVWVNFDIGGLINPRIISYEDSRFHLATFGTGSSRKVGASYHNIFINSSHNIDAGKWYHIGVSFTTNEARLYINGQLDTVVNANLIATNIWTQFMKIGSKTSIAYDSWKGKIDEVRLYNRALTAAEIQLLYKPANYNFARCEGDTLKFLTPSVSGVSYTWKKGGTTVSDIKTKATLADMGTYNLSISYKGCTFSDTTVVNSIKTNPSIMLNDTSICKGTTANLQVTTGYQTYQWSVGNSTTAMNPISPLSTQPVVVTVKDSYGCSTKDTSLVTVRELPKAQATTPTPSVCAGSKIVLTASPTGAGLSYEWLNNNIIITGEAKETLQVGQAGSYRVRVRDVSGCDSLSQPIVVVLNPLPITKITSVPTPEVCSGQSIKLTATGGTQYKWSDGNLTNTTTVVPLQTGYYIVTVTDANSCTKTDSINIKVNPLPSIGTPSVTNIKCRGANDGIVALTASGGTGTPTFSINPVVGTQSGGTFTGLTAQTYTFTATDTKGCSVSRTATVTVVATAIAFSTPSVTNVKCNGSNDGKIIISANGGTGQATYSINPIPTGSTQSPNGTFNNLPAQTYIFTATDANNCSTTTSVAVMQPNPVIISAPSVTHVKCRGGNDGKIVLLSSGGTGTLNLTISPNIGSQPTGGTFTGLTAQTYTFTATDNNGCTASQTTAVSEPAAVLSLSNPVLTNVKCNGRNDGKIVVSASGGTNPIVYSLTPNLGTQTPIGSFNNLTAETYTVKATDANGCTDTKPAPITQPTVMATDIIKTDPSFCLPTNGSADAIATGGTIPYTYLWNNNATAKKLSNLPAGIYKLTITDAQGCSQNATTTLVAVSDSLAAPSVTATSIGVDSIVFTWLAVPNAARYEVQVKKGNWIPANGNLSHIVKGLKEYENVDFAVRGISDFAKCGGKTTTTQEKTKKESCVNDLVDVIPNGFTPGGNGTNDYFDPEKYIHIGGCSSNVIAKELHIYNRWGELLYKSNPYEKWDGLSRNQQYVVPSGVYFYVFVVEVEGVRKSVKGTLNVFGD